MARWSLGKTGGASRRNRKPSRQPGVDITCRNTQEEWDVSSNLSGLFKFILEENYKGKLSQITDNALNYLNKEYYASFHSLFLYISSLK